MFWLICYPHNSKYATDLFADVCTLSKYAPFNYGLSQVCSRLRWKDNSETYTDLLFFVPFGILVNLEGSH